MSNLTIFLNQQYLPQNEAKISIFDRGLLFGDSVYEVIPFYKGTPIGFDEHLERLSQSLAQLGMSAPYANEEWLSVCQILMEKNPQLGDQQGIYLQVTRGVQAKRNHNIPENYEPTVFAFPLKIPNRSAEEIAQGYTAHTEPDLRHQLCNIKSTNLLANILAMHDATETGASEAILIRDGNAMELCSSNLFIVKNNVIITPPATPHILNGITRQQVIKLAQSNNLTVEERNIALAQLYHADEVWMSSSMKFILPIVKVDGKAIADGKPGKMWQMLYNAMTDF